MNTIALPVEQTPCVFAPDDTVSDDVMQQRIRAAQRDALQAGPVSTTVRERVTNENIVQLARHNMLYMQTENLRRWLSHRVNSDRMYDATEGIAEAVLQ